ncbi:hypothetical protein LWI28_027054 [Acer negundo]|uniref:Uncharacterized protein n=1 Tax=Acer negundo TaxID=4023 RepID=A0AAD5JNA4_ACENE|nr:hypothetical protein LWI28_027054 [Acer negundo]KAK4856641.1 hypothetical protein QYF36_019601 [Acer negundo]
MSWGGVMAGQLGWGIIEESWRKGPWTSEEDSLLIEYVRLHGEGRWNSVARLAGLRRNGKSCRLRWVNYLRPDLKRGQITPHEESIILDLHARWGNRWSTIARSLPGRTDNEIKNYWRTHFKKKAKISSAADNSDKAKNNRLLKRQQFHQQQQQQQQQHEQQVLQQQEQQQQQQMMQLNQLDMKKIMFLLDENYEQKSTISPIYLHQPRQEMVGTNLYLDHEQVQQAAAGSFFNYNNSMPNNNGSAASVSTAETTTSNEDILWDGLWNLDDFHVNFGGACATSKASLHNLVAPFC